MENSLKEELEAANGAKVTPNCKVGAVMMVGGLALAVMPGLPGIPLMVLGSAMLSPRVPALKKFDRWLNRNFPAAREEALNFYDRFSKDYARRYPTD